jgi:hypothetical protein
VSRELFQHDPDVGFRFTPKIRTRVSHEGGGYLVETNAQGFRSPHDFSAAPGDKRRIFVFGDSYTAGDGVSNGARYSDIIERRLGYTEVYNFGLPGTGTDQHYLVWKKYAQSLPHDVVVIAVQVENIRRVVAHYREFKSADGQNYLLAKPFFTDEGDQLRFRLRKQRVTG